MTTRARRTSRPLLALLVPLAVALTGCTGQDAADAGSSASGGGTAAVADGHQHADSHADDHAGGHPGHADPAAVLLRVSDLPAGYHAGHVHASAATGDEPTPASCRPLAALLRQSSDDSGHHAGGHAGMSGHAMSMSGHAMTTMHGEHEAATVAYSKSHFGPVVSQSVVDVGGFAPAAAAVRRVEAAATDCPEYVQSTSRIGANRYSVAPLDVPADAEPGTYVRLTAEGADFARGIHWDLWVHDCEGMLVAVTFRSALGGDDADFWPAVSAAMDRVHGA